jgi:hypothetical protein
MEMPRWLAEWKQEGRESLREYIVEFDLGTSFFQNTIVRILLVLGFFPLLASVLILGATIFPIEIPLILRYNVYFGVSLLGDWWQVYIFPMAGLFLYGVHVFLAHHYYQLRERVASYLVLLASAFMSMGIFLVALSLSLVNF